MIKLKCWKKTNKKEIIEYTKPDNSVIWINKKIPNYVNYAEFDKGLWKNGFTKRFENLKNSKNFLNNHLKRHDKC